MPDLTKNYITSDNEFSKRFTKSIRNFMFVHVSISLVACIVMPILGVDYEGILSILESMMPVYIALQGANYVKSGFENVKKISVSSGTSDEECENG